MSLAQIGEFAFVLLSRASNLHLVEVNTHVAVYDDIILLRNLYITTVDIYEILVFLKNY